MSVHSSAFDVSGRRSCRGFRWVHRCAPIRGRTGQTMAKEKFDRSKPHCNVGTIGHVDHGKT
ncbi:hypothetical protein GHC57_18640, partial [Roseospira navarrensis]|nr:hypothetical protein [Roseospira navarrensis]